MTMMRLVIVFATLGMLTMPVMGAVVVIDDFRAGTFALYGTGTNTGFGDTIDIIGGQRDTTFTVTAGTASLDCVGGIHYTSGENGGQAWWSLEYGLNANLDADLTAVGREMISVDVAYKNIPDSVPLTITITSEKGTLNEHESSVSKDITGVVNSGIVTYVFPFSEFEGVNFRDVDYLKFAFDCTSPSLNGLDFVIGDYYFCPEPGTFSLLALAGLALIRARRG